MDYQRCSRSKCHPILGGDLKILYYSNERKTAGTFAFYHFDGANSDEQKLVCFQYQVDDFIEKPFSAELIRWWVKSFFSFFLFSTQHLHCRKVKPEKQCQISF